MTEHDGAAHLERVVRGWGVGPVVVATVAPAAGDPRTLVVGVDADPALDVELGSVSKALTGLLFEDAIERGEVARTTTLADALPVLGDAPCAAVTLEALATHRSGLPRLPRGSATLRRQWDLVAHGRNPYGESVAEVLAQAARTRLTRKVNALYSNLGYELLGHAVAARAGLPYTELMRTRLAEPLGLASVYVPASSADLRPTAMPGFSPRGRPREAWVGEGLGPAGGVRASVPDVARLAVKLLDQAAPGMAALDPRVRFAGPLRVGSAWMTVPVRHEGQERRITWHNGGTGGFRSFLGLDRERGTAVVAVSPRARALDRPARELLLAL
ncbi:serine hydrolase domain-containing protein [Miniimonas arenae]|uniref:serine hydrolase domain-containing protein n=1 Tax=Miniimonas arenae TaxID=676201 RepID=UPI0028AE9162|nr:serine hydrolase domain-containing protein [Miniimonas arenae]